MASSRAVTLLFTDLVGSTALAAAAGPEAADQLRQAHFGVLRQALEATGGSEVKNLGDGLMVVFTSPSRALACAVAMQQGLERHNRRTNSALSIRIGLSAGEVTEDDGDFFGEPVVTASRLCAEAEGGQILAAELVQLMVGRHVTQEVTPRGRVRLKGLPEPISVIEVGWEPETDSTAEGARLPLPPQLLGGTASGLFAFFGRTAEVDHLAQEHKMATLESRLRAVLVCGEPGVGKTTLAAQAARSAHDGGATILFGGCEEDLGAPYQPWLGALGHLVAHVDQAVLESLSPAHASALTRLLPTALSRLPEPAVPTADAQTERYLAMEAVVALFERASVEAPMVLLLDDLQWADVASLQLVRHLVASGAALRVMLVGTYRDSDLGRSSPLSALLADLWRDGRVSRLRLSGLSDSDVVELVEAAAGYQLDEDGLRLAQTVWRETDGNPFFVGELLRHLAESGSVVQGRGGRWGLADDLDEITLPSSIREVVNQRIDRLGPDAVPALSAAAVIGREFDLETLAAVTGHGEDRLLDLLDASQRAALVGETDSGRYRFLHALIQRTLYSELSANRRQRLHLRVAETLETGRARYEPAEMARHWLAASRPIDTGKALEYATAAGDAALNALAPDDAAGWYTRALELLTDDSSENLRRRGWLFLKLGTAQAQGQRPGFWETLLEAADLARGVGDEGLLVEVALTRGHGQEIATEAEPRRLAVIREALNVVGTEDTPARALLLAALGEELDPREWQARHEVVHEARTLARRLGDRGILTSVLIRTGGMSSLPGQLAARRADSAELLELTREADLATRYKALFFDASVRVEGGDVDGLDADLEEMDRIAQQTGLALHRWETISNRGWRLLLAGRAAEAEAAAEEAYSLYQLDDPIGLAVYGAEIMAVRRFQGRQEEMLEPFRQVVAANPALPVMRLALMLLLCESGRYEEARRLFEDELAAGFDPPRDTTWVQSMVRCAEVAIALQHEAAAVALYERLEPLRDIVSYNVSMDGGAVALHLGQLAILLGRYDQADADLARAMELHEGLRAPYWVARTQLARAVLLLARAGGSGGRGAGPLIEEARQLAAAARGTIEQYGCHGLDRALHAVDDRLRLSSPSVEEA